MLGYSSTRWVRSLNGMAARWIAAAMAATMFLIVGFFVIVALRGPATGVVTQDPPAADDPLAGSTTTHRIGRFTLTATTALRSGQVEITFMVRGQRGEVVVSEKVPSVVLQMSGMESMPVELQRTSSGLWHGSGRPSMSGNWLFVVTIEGEQISVPIDVP
jgi:hypothetical protein